MFHEVKVKKIAKLNVNFWATVCKTVRPMLSVRCPVSPVCPVSLSATFVHCGETVGRIKMKLGMQVGLGPGHIVLDRDQLPSPKGAQPPNFRPISPYLLRPNGCMDQDVTWYGAMPWPSGLCVRWGPRCPLPMAHVYCGQTAGWI